MIDTEYIDWNWIELNMDADPARLRLSAHGDEKKMFEIIQIDCRRRCRKKLAETLSRFPRFLFLSTLSAQQSTSDLLAGYHASLTGDGMKILDMTGGLGIDGLHLSAKASEITLCELNADTAECARRNFHYIGAENVTVLNCDSVDYITHLPDSAFDCIFIDPARRGSDGQRLFALSQCTPNVIAILDDMLRVAPQVIIKASPMLDIKHTLSELRYVKRIIALGNRNECKELIIECRRGSDSIPELESVTLDSSRIWRMNMTSNSIAETSEKASVSEGNLIYDPFPAFVKLCSMPQTAIVKGIHKIAPHTNLYISAHIEPDFPGTPYEIVSACEMSRRTMKDIAARYPNLDVTAKNFPMTSVELTKRLKTESGSEFRLFAFKDEAEKKMLTVCRRT